MAEKKSTLLAVLEVLKEYSDEDHLLTRTQMLDMIKAKRGLTMDRRTLYSCIGMLKEYGYDISSFEENGRGYALIQRDFSVPEILWLSNAVHASNFIPRKSSSELIRKLMATQSEYINKEYSNTVFLPNYRKTQNSELFHTIDQVSAAIRGQHDIAFTYLSYNTKGNLVSRRDRPYILQPRFIVYSEGRGYLIATDEKHSGFSHYRLDRMSNVKILEETKTPPLGKEQDPYDYAKNKLFMFAGENIGATLKCRMSVLNQMVDIFGKDMTVLEEDEEYFVMRIHASQPGIIWLAQQFVDAVEVLSPESVRNTMRENLKKALDLYEE